MSGDLKLLKKAPLIFDYDVKDKGNEILRVLSFDNKALNLLNGFYILEISPKFFIFSKIYFIINFSKLIYLE